MLSYMVESSAGLVSVVCRQECCVSMKWGPLVGRRARVGCYDEVWCGCIEQVQGTREACHCYWHKMKNRLLVHPVSSLQVFPLK